MRDVHRSQRMGDENHPATKQEIAQFKNKIKDDKKLDVHVLAIFEIDKSDLNASPDTITEATRQTVEQLLKKSFGEFDTVKFVLATTNTDPRIEGAEKCTVERVPSGHFIIRGDDKLANDVRAKIGLGIAKVFPSS